MDEMESALKLSIGDVVHLCCKQQYSALATHLDSDLNGIDGHQGLLVDYSQ